MSLFKSIKIINSGKAILLSRKHGAPLRYHSTWLRDNSLDGKTRNKKNGLRLISISDIPVNTEIEDEKNVWFFKATNAEDLAAKMLRVLNTQVVRPDIKELKTKRAERIEKLGNALTAAISFMTGKNLKGFQG